MIRLSQLIELASAAYGVHPRVQHLLGCWVKNNDHVSELRGYIETAGLSIESFTETVDMLIGQPSSNDLEMLKSLLLGADQTLTGRDLLLHICRKPEHRITRAFVEAGLDADKLLHNLEIQPASGYESILARHAAAVESRAGVLSRYCRDLTSEASDGSFDHLYDRSEDEERLIQAIIRQRKGNAVLTGDAGVGKTACVELLARRIVRNDVPESLRGTCVLELSLHKLLAGTRYRGDMEERLEQILAAVMSLDKAVLFIDEMHLIWGAGRAEGAPMDVANLLKPFLARGRVRVIGATTTEEYHQYIARDSALDRRFEEIKLSEPSPGLTRAMVRMQADALESGHILSIPDDIVDRAIALTDNYVPNRQQPDKAADLLDLASVITKGNNREQVEEDDLLRVLAQRIGCSIEKLQGDERENLRDLSSHLKKRIVGQNEAIERVNAVIAYRKQGLAGLDRNVAAFLFAGSTGTGKTTTSTALAEFVYGDPKAILHIDLGEYSTSGSVSKLIGSPAGFVDSEREGLLIHWLHSSGRGVLLFDEIEKAHPDIHQMLLGVLDNGRIRSSKGEEMDTRQCIICMTTNALTPEELKKDPIGFRGSSVGNDAFDLLSRHFSPEFLGRFDELIIFNSLKPDDLREILRLRLREAVARLAEKKIKMEYDESRLINHLFADLEKDKTGARGITRLLERKLLQPAALAALDAPAGQDAVIVLGENYYSDCEVSLAFPK